MRIIAGYLKGRKIAAPKGARIRPTTDRVRENIFNILGDYPRGSKVLDIFAGSGGMGLESMSRGADEVTFVDVSAAAIETIKKNLAATGLQLSADVHNCAAEDYLSRHKELKEKFNLIFLDPPYKISGFELRRVFNELPNHLAVGGLLILELGRESPKGLSNSLTPIDKRRYGDTYIFIFKRREDKK